ALANLDSMTGTVLPGLLWKSEKLHERGVARLSQRGQPRLDVRHAQVVAAGGGFRLADAARFIHILNPLHGVPGLLEGGDPHIVGSGLNAVAPGRRPAHGVPNHVEPVLANKIRHGTRVLARDLDAMSRHVLPPRTKSAIRKSGCQLRDAF